MRPVAKALLAAASLAASGCCWPLGSGACVVDGGWGGQACTVSEDQYPVCMVEQPQPQPVETCAGTFHGGEDCAGVGFTVECGNGWWVRPGTPCG